MCTVDRTTVCDVILDMCAQSPKALNNTTPPILLLLLLLLFVVVVFTVVVIPDYYREHADWQPPVMLKWQGRAGRCCELPT